MAAALQRLPNDQSGDVHFAHALTAYALAHAKLCAFPNANEDGSGGFAALYAAVECLQDSVRLSNKARSSFSSADRCSASAFPATDWMSTLLLWASLHLSGQLWWVLGDMPKAMFCFDKVASVVGTWTLAKPLVSASLKPERVSVADFQLSPWLLALVNKAHIESFLAAHSAAKVNPAEAESVSSKAKLLALMRVLYLPSTKKNAADDVEFHSFAAIFMCASTVLSWEIEERVWGVDTASNSQPATAAALSNVLGMFMNVRPAFFQTNDLVLFEGLQAICSLLQRTALDESTMASALQLSAAMSSFTKQYPFSWYLGSRDARLQGLLNAVVTLQARSRGSAGIHALLPTALEQLSVCLDSGMRSPADWLMSTPLLRAALRTFAASKVINHVDLIPAQTPSSVPARQPGYVATLSVGLCTRLKCLRLMSKAQLHRAFDSRMDVLAAIGSATHPPIDAAANAARAALEAMDPAAEWRRGGTDTSVCTPQKWPIFTIAYDRRLQVTVLATSIDGVRFDAVACPANNGPLLNHVQVSLAEYQSILENSKQTAIATQQSLEESKLTNAESASNTALGQKPKKNIMAAPSKTSFVSGPRAWQGTGSDAAADDVAMDEDVRRREPGINAPQRSPADDKKLRDAFWSSRYKLDKRMRQLCAALQQSVLGPDAEQLLLTISDRCHVAPEAIQEQREKTVGPARLLSFGEEEDATDSTNNAPASGSLNNARNRADSTDMEDIAPLNEPHMIDERLPGPSKNIEGMDVAPSILLLVCETLHSLPWESLPVWRTDAETEAINGYAESDEAMRARQRKQQPPASSAEKTAGLTHRRVAITRLPYLSFATFCLRSQNPHDALYGAANKAGALQMLGAETLRLLSGARAVLRPDLGATVVAHPGMPTGGLGYFVNPSGDLRRTEHTLGPLLDDLGDALQAAGAGEKKGIVGRSAEKDEVLGLLGGSRVYVYCGHGAGEAFLPRDEVLSAAPRCPPSLLMGCSSGRLVRSPALGGEPDGPVLSYLLSGCTAVVGCLWDVTDKDIDRYTAALLSQWPLMPAHTAAVSVGATADGLPAAVVSSRTSCRLPYLIGSAPVMFGLPVHGIHPIKSGAQTGSVVQQERTQPRQLLFE
jgi:hypothetical protein